MLVFPTEWTLPQTPQLITPLPGPNACKLIQRDRAVASPSYTRGYPLAVASGSGCAIEDVDGNVFLEDV